MPSPSASVRLRRPSTHLASASRFCGASGRVGWHTTSTALWPGCSELPNPTTDTTEPGASALNAIVRAASCSFTRSASLMLPDSSTSTTIRSGGSVAAGSRAEPGAAVAGASTAATANAAARRTRR
nr:hypothetical protein [Actinokineospora iranica]